MGFLLLLAGVLVVIVTIVHTGQQAREWQRKRNELIEVLKRDNDIPELVDNGKAMVGVNGPRRELFLFEEDGAGTKYSFDHLLAVHLVPIYESNTDSDSITTTRRGSQLIGAGIGTAIAGPAGGVIGALSASSSTHSSATTSNILRAFELTLRLRDDQLPITKFVVHRDFSLLETIAARLANHLDVRGGAPLSDPPAPVTMPAPGGSQPLLLWRRLA